MSRALRGALIAGPAGAALFASLFMSWFGDASGWEALGWLEVGVIAAAGLASAIFAAVVWAGLSVSLPVAASALTTLGGLVAFAFVLHRLVNEPGVGGGRDLGLYVALAACVAMVLGGYVGMQEEDVPATASPA